MQKQDIETILASQRKFFATGKTLPVSWRLEQLKKLRASMLRHEEDLYGALKKDLSVPDTVRHGSDHESMELSGTPDTGTSD